MEDECRPETSPLRVLLVEDNPGDADLVILSLSEFSGDIGEVRRAERLADARTALAGSRSDVVLLDLSLPDASGLEALEILRTEHPDLPIVVLTGALGDLGARALCEGAQDYLIKGQVDGPLLLRALRYSIERLRIERRDRLLVRERAAREGAEQAERRAALLASLSKTFGSSLDFGAALEQATPLLLPGFADGVVVERAGLTGDPTWTVAHADPAEGELWTTVARGLADGGGRRGLAALLRDRSFLQIEGRRPVELAELLGAPIPVGLPDVLLASALVVPLAGLGRRHGAIAFLAHEPERRFGLEANRMLAEEIGLRAGAALENARLYQEAKRAVAARDEFLSIASHELRTPLTALQLRLQTVRRRECHGADEATSRALAIADRQVRRLDRLISSLLDVSRITTGRIELEPENLDLARVAEATVERLAEEAAAHGTPVRFQAEGDTSGRFDRLAIERVLTNLLANAFKYGAGQPVELSVGSRDDELWMCVADRGIGIQPEDQARVFSRFERAVSSRHFGGLGLGLFITRKLIEAHGGSIELASRPGAGSRFTARIPRALAGASEELPGTERASGRE